MEAVLFPLSSIKSERSQTKNSMKILICNDDPCVMSKLMERPLAARHVVIPCLEARDLIRMVAATEPHIIVVGGGRPRVDSKALERRLREAGFRVPMVFLPDDHPEDIALEDLEKCVSSMSDAPNAITAGSQDYKVVIEKPIEQRGAARNGAIARVEHEEAKFLSLLAGGSSHHEQARSYLNLCGTSQVNHEQDWATAAVCGGPEAYMWRAQLFRYVSVLAHYVPGVDVDCLPLPKPASAKLDFLHTALSTEAFYALNALRSFGIDPVLERGLWEVGQIETPETANLTDVARLAGWASIVRQAAIAHVKVMAACLSEGACALSGGETTRSAMNHRKSFLHFWNLKGLADPDLRRLGEEFWTGRRASGVAAFCSFYDFVDNFHKVELVAFGRN
jgi:hypothetical protein